MNSVPIEILLAALTECENAVEAGNSAIDEAGNNLIATEQALRLAQLNFDTAKIANNTACLALSRLRRNYHEAEDAVKAANATESVDQSVPAKIDAMFAIYF